MGRVFERTGEGHQFNQHYLDCMFPLKACPAPSSPSSNLGSSSKTEAALSWFTSIFRREGNTQRGGIGGSGFLGCDEEPDPATNPFMESILELGYSIDEKKDEREGWEISYLGCHGQEVDLAEREKEVLIRDMSPTSTFTVQKLVEGEDGIDGVEMNGVNGDEQGKELKRQFKVKDLSRLWLYVNGKSPKMDEVDAGIERMATI